MSHLPTFIVTIVQKVILMSKCLKCIDFSQKINASSPNKLSMLIKKIKNACSLLILRIIVEN